MKELANKKIEDIQKEIATEKQKIAMSEELITAKEKELAEVESFKKRLSTVYKIKNLDSEMLGKRINHLVNKFMVTDFISKLSEITGMNLDYSPVTSNILTLTIAQAVVLLFDEESEK
jgi:hypothetical protein